MQISIEMRRLLLWQLPGLPRAAALPAGVFYRFSQPATMSIKFQPVMFNWIFCINAHRR